MTGEELKALRMRLTLSQTEMAEKLGISRSAVAKLEGGENAMSTPVELLARQLHAQGGNEQ